MADRPSEQLRRAQELLRALRTRDVPDLPELAVAADLPVGAVLAAARGQVAEPRTTLAVDGSVPTGPGGEARELAGYRVAAAPVLAAELGVPATTEVDVRELLVTRHGVPLQFRSSSSSGPVEGGTGGGALLRPVDVEAVRADEGTATALGIPAGTVVLLQVVLVGAVDGPRRVDFVYSRADLVRIETH